MSANTKLECKNTNDAPSPSFLVKLVGLLENSDNQQYIQWNDNSKSINILDQKGLSKYVLPKYFKHSNFNSFHRQLNIYGFGKIAPLSYGLVQHKEEVERNYPFFIRKIESEGLKTNDADLSLNSNSKSKEQKTNMNLCLNSNSEAKKQKTNTDLSFNSHSESKEQKTNATSIPLFLLKLVDLLDNSDNKQYVQWSANGKSFIVLNQEGFSKNVLPKYFKHNQLSSFTRQLNLYGFRKILPLSHGSVQLEEQLEFRRPFFVRGKVNMLPLIKRKVTTISNPNSMQAEDTAAVLDEVTEIKDNQSKLTQTLSDMKQENEDLLREVVSLRQKYAQLEEVVNHLLTCSSSGQCHETSRKRILPNEWKNIDCNVIASKISKPVLDDTTSSTNSTSQDIDFINNTQTVKDGLIITELPSTSSSPSTAVQVCQDSPNDFPGLNENSKNGAS